MEVILVDDVEGLGKKGATVKVAAGYARNFLLPRKLAISTGAKAARVFQEMARQREIANDKSKRAAEALAEKYRGIVVEAKARAGEDGTLFGSITSSDIAELLEKQGLPTDRKKIALEDHIKTVGEHTVHVKLHAGVDAPITVRVVTAS
ncbi:MAG: 50S ribosomal protein L9 [Candidatus Eiseniibacteriota bacterium]